MTDGNVTRTVKSRAFAERLNAMVTGAHADELGAAFGDGPVFGHDWYVEATAMATEPAEAAAAIVVLTSTLVAVVHALAAHSGASEAEILQNMAVANLHGATEP